MEPAQLAMGGSSRVWEYHQRRPSAMSPPSTPVRVVEQRTRPPLMILKPGQVQRGRCGPLDRLGPCLQVKNNTLNCFPKQIYSQWSCCKRGLYVPCNQLQHLPQRNFRINVQRIKLHYRTALSLICGGILPVLTGIQENRIAVPSEVAYEREGSSQKQRNILCQTLLLAK